MNNTPSGMKKIPVRVLALIIGGLCYFLSNLGIEMDTVMSAIAVLLFFGAIGYYLLPKTQGRKRGPAKPKHKQYDDSRLTDYMMERIMKAYNVKEEPNDPDEESSEDNELDEFVESEFDEGANEEIVEEEATDEVEAFPTFHYNGNGKIENKPQPTIYSGQDGEEEATGSNVFFSPAQLPLTLSGMWFIIIVVIYTFFPDAIQSISKSISPSAFTILPILFLVGLSGLLGILLKQPSENLEVTPKEKTTFTLNVFKILVGWGIGFYVFIINF